MEHEPIVEHELIVEIVIIQKTKTQKERKDIMTTQTAKEAKENLSKEMNIPILRFYRYKNVASNYYLVVKHKDKRVDVKLGKVADLQRPIKVQESMLKQGIYVPLLTKKQWQTKCLPLLMEILTIYDLKLNTDKENILTVLKQYINSQQFTTLEDIYFVEDKKNDPLLYQPFLYDRCFNLTKQAFSKLIIDNDCMMNIELEHLDIELVRMEDFADSTFTAWRIPKALIDPLDYCNQ